MKRFKLLVFALTLSLSTLTYSALGGSASAALECTDLQYCTGAAGCSGSGYESSFCVIECTGGGTITCGIEIIIEE